MKTSIFVAVMSVSLAAVVVEPSAFAEPLIPVNQVFIEAKFIDVGLDDQSGLGVAFGVGGDADYLNNIPALPGSRRWIHQLGVTLAKLDDASLVGAQASVKNLELVRIPRVPITVGGGISFYGYHIGAYSERREETVTTQHPDYYDRTITVTQITDHKQDARTQVGLGAEINATTRLPFLNKIPLTGSLFAGRSLNEDSTELIIFITARLVRPSEQ